MTTRFIPLLSAGAALTLATSAPAAPPPPGHSSHGEAFNEGPRQAARLLQGVDGIVSFPVTTKNPEAQRFFDQGVCQLHGFWYFEAERSFRQAAAIDPDCAMAYWGMAMANRNNEDRARGFLSKAVALKDQTSPREQLWIASLENYFPKEDKRSKTDRALACISDLETIVQGHPQDVEAKAFLAWSIWAHKRDAPISSHQAVDALLDQVFAANPMHPAHHYRIHLWDGKKPARALASCAVGGQSAPGIAHLWHMPGHIYSKLKRFDDAVWQQEASSRVDHRHMIDALILPDQIHNYAHNEEWLIRNYAELGRAHDGIALAKSLIEIPRHPKYNTLDKSSSSASYGRTRLISTLLTWELWDNLIALNESPYLEPAVQTGHEVTRHRALAVAYFHQQQSDDLKASIATLEKLKSDAAAKSKADAKKAKDAKDAKDAKEEAGKTNSKDKTEPKPPAKKKTRKAEVDKALAEAKALQMILEKNAGAAKALRAAAPDIPKERLIRYWLELGHVDETKKLIEQLPQTIAGDIVRVDALLQTGNKKAARPILKRLRKNAAGMDENIPAARRLQSLAKQFGLKNDWRRPAAPAKDLGERPDQESLGPLHWHPPTAPYWEGIGLDGLKVTSSDAAHRKGPLVVLFYLGHECIHCMEQVVEFAKASKKFDQAGIEIIAIGADTPQDLPGALEKSPTPGHLPFPILADPEMISFKNFRAYDDFEEMPMHAVALIDAEGRLRWIDTGYDPFADVDFLLKECRRLLRFDLEAPIASKN